MHNTESVPKAMQGKYDDITGMTDAFCAEYLNEEYAQLSRKLAAALARKRPSPLQRGRTKTWACGIVYTIGSVNFLSDPSFAPHMRLEEVCEKMGVSKSTGSAKATEIRKMFDMFQMHPDWSLPSRLDYNPLVWMLKVNGVIMDIRNAPREAQEEALRQGLIPYIPE